MKYQPHNEAAHGCGDFASAFPCQAFLTFPTRSGRRSPISISLDVAGALAHGRGQKDHDG